MKILIWDLDDTLVDNVHDYAEPLLDSCRLIIRELGAAAPHVTAIIELEQEIDKKRVGEINPDTGKPFGYTMERFPGSMVELYVQICKKSGLTPKAYVATELNRIGLMAFDKKRYKDNIKPGAIHLLKTARDNGHRNVLLTKGDERVQQMKVDALLDAAKEKIFDEIRIVETTKDPAIFLEIADAQVNRADDRVIAIGNDYAKDVLPALKAHPAFQGIWIPVETWEVTAAVIEKQSVEMDKRCTLLHRLAQMEGMVLP